MANPLDSFKNMPTWGKGAAVIGGLGVAYVVYKNHAANAAASSSSAPATTAATTGTDPYPPDGTSGNPNDPYSTDPSSGMTYGDEQAGYSGYGFGSTAYNSGLASPEYGSNPYSGAVTTAGYSSNSAWAQAVETGLTDIGYTSTDVSDALGAWMAGQNLTADQASIVQAAIAEFGDPPSGSYPILRAPSTTTTGSGTGTTTTPPPVTTPKKTTAAKPGMPSGVSATAVTSNGFHMIWHAVSGATSYRVRVTYQSQVVFQGTSAQPSINVTGLTPDHTYTTHVAASNSAGMSSETNGPSVHTTK
jgi:Fibronectin type III domain